MTRTISTDETCAVPGLTPEVYAKWRASELGRITEGIERGIMLEMIGDVSGKRVLEIGCGDGDLAVKLARMGASVTGVDASADMIAAAERRSRAAGADIRFQVATAQRLPFPDETFDIVVAMTILCFVRDAEPVFHEVARVIRPGGKLVIGELGRRSAWAAERRIRAWLGSELWKRGVFRTPDELRRLAGRAGLQSLRIRPAVFFPRWTPLARWIAPYDAHLGRLTHVGAAFLAMEATKAASAAAAPA
jgi:2-polyprenyl-3-methyl-5-hydroxy-6-metoxy-1,4-benzoquinol methylase